MLGPRKEFISAQRCATRALLRFCKDHDKDTEVPNTLLRESLAALEEADMGKAVEKFQGIHLGPHGFDDWFPPAVYPNENDVYVRVVFESLVERWARLMSLSVPEKPVD